MSDADGTNKMNWVKNYEPSNGVQNLLTINPSKFSLGDFGVDMALPDTSLPSVNIGADAADTGLFGRTFDWIGDKISTVNNWGKNNFGTQVTDAEGNIKNIGGWTNAADIAMDFGELGLGIANYNEQSKMNDFMQSYYGDQMDMQRADYESNAKSANQENRWRQMRILNAQGIEADSEEMTNRLDAHMDKWGVQETF